MGITGQIPPPEEQDAPGDPESVARAICLRLLTQRARSRAELAQALRRRGLPDDVAEAVLTRYVEVGLIDDDSLARQLAQTQHRERGLAGRAVALRLRQRGLPADEVESAISQIDAGSERDTARGLVVRKLPSLRDLPDEVRTRRLIGLLARRGYAPGLAGEVVREVLRASFDESLADEFAGD